MAKQKSKSKPSKKKKEEAIKHEVADITDEIIALPTIPHALPEDIINLWTVPTIKERDRVAPSTPNYNQVRFERDSVEPLPANYPNLDMLKIPYIRKMGIKSCIELLGRFFNCNSYTSNHLHFWFLDVITDCLWRLQDDFQLPDDDQKKVLEYFLYFFKMITDTRLNYSRKAFLRTFKETIYLIGDLIEEGCLVIPTPDSLFTLTDYSDNDSESSRGISTISVSNSEDAEMEAHIGVKLENVVHIFKLNNHISADNIFDVVSKASSYDPKKLPSDADSLTSPIVIMEKEKKETETDHITESVNVGIPATSLMRDIVTDPIMDPIYNLSDFYQPDLSTPPRFLSSELAFARYRAKEVEYLADGAEEDYEYEGINANEGSSSSSGWTIRHSEHNIDQEQADGIDKSQLSDISQFMSKSDPCMITIPVPHHHKKKSLPVKNYPDAKSGDSHSINQSQQQAKQSITMESKSLYDGKPAAPANTSLSSLSDTSSSNSINRLIRSRKKAKRDKQLKAWKDFNLNQQHVDNMTDPDVGWQPDGKDFIVDRKSDLNLNRIRSESIDTDLTLWRELIIDNIMASRNADERKRINMVITSAIIDCVFEYLYDSFHFTLIKLAFQSTPYLISQNVNFEWKLPKVPKAEFTRPARAKVKTPKVKKEKKSKSKSSKSKSSKKSSKKSAKSKKSKKDKKSKKSSKGSKGSKGPKMSKAELDRLKKEKARLDEERLRIEENKKYMFPLTDAATDDLFENMFENWVKPKSLKNRDKKEKGKGKGKKK